MLSFSIKTKYKKNIMKQSILIVASLLFTCGVISAQNQEVDDGDDSRAVSGQVYVVPVDASGHVVQIAGTHDYEGEVLLESVEGAEGLTAKAVHIEYGFLLYAEDDSESLYTFYTSSNPTQPPVMGESFDVMITNDESKYIKVSPGVYNITFFPRLTNHESNRCVVSTSTMTDAPVVSVSGESAVYYDLQGRRVPAEDLKAGLYVRVADGQVTKVMKR